MNLSLLQAHQIYFLISHGLQQDQMRKFLSKYDLFPASPILRARGQTEVVNLCGSLFSICIFGIFTYVFINSIVSTVQLQNINATETIQTDGESQPTVKGITVGIGLQGSNILNHRDIFELKAYTTNKTMIPNEISTFPCYREFWSSFSDAKYNSLNLAEHLCIQRDGVEVYGANGSPQNTVLYILLKQCDNATSPIVCKSPADINQYFNTSMFWNRFVACSMVILDTGISPQKKDATSYVAYEKTLWLLFNQQQQILGQMFLGTYVINTDTNFLPFNSVQTQSGYFVNQATVTTLVNVFNRPEYIQFYIFASPINRVINRDYGKFDGVLSYVGGLYGIVISFLAFFIASFNQYKYELRVSEGALNYKDGSLAREDNFHFGKYLKYVVYDWVKTLFCCEIKWEDCKAIDRAREEANQQIDVKHLLKRISHLEKVNSVIMSSADDTILYISDSASIGEKQHRRAITQYCQKFVEGNKSITIQVLQKQNDQMHSTQIFSTTNSNIAAVVPMEIVGSQTLILKSNKKKKNLKTNFSGQIQLGEQQQLPTSLEIMKQYLKKFEQNFGFTKEQFSLDEQNLRIQKQITQAFYGLEEKNRNRVIKKIPLGILYRIKKCKEELDKSKNYGTNNTIGDLLIPVDKQTTVNMKSTFQIK